MIETKRLILRQWTEDDFAPFAELNADKDVMEYFPAPLSAEDSNKFAEKTIKIIETKGWGLWAVEEKKSACFIGFVGLHDVLTGFSFSPFVEVGWRLSKKYWGKGYATEAANAALKFAFEDLGLDDVVSFTATLNKKSQAVMKRINMKNTNQNFMHPKIPPAHRLCEHVLYKITKSEWEEANQ